MEQVSIQEQIEIAKKVWVRPQDIQKFCGCSYPKAISIKDEVVHKYYKEGETPTMRGAILGKFFLKHLNITLQDLQERASL